MRANLLEPKASLAALILRLGLAAIFIVHGYIKIYVSIQMVPELSMEAQRAMGWLELICGLLLMVGLASRIAALHIIILQASAIALITGKYAMEVSMTGKGADYMRVGPEYNLALIAMGLGVVVLGSGVVSLDHLIVNWWRNRKAPAAPVTSSTSGAV